MARTRLLAVLLAVVLVVGLALSGCGGSGKPAPASEPKPSAPATTPEPAKQPEPAKRVFLSIAGGPASGSAVMDSVSAVAGLLNKEMPNINVTAETSAGGTENVRRVHSKQADMAGAFAADLFDGYNGKFQFQGQPQDNMRAIGVLQVSYTHFVTLKSSNIKKLEDLQGKKVAVGGQGTGTAFLNERLFKELGMWDKLKVVYLGGTDAATALKDGQIDAFIWSQGLPGPTIVDVASVKDIVLLDAVTPGTAVKFFEKYPAYYRGEIPANTYKGQDKPVPVIVSSIHWIVNKDVDADLVYNMTKKAYSPAGVEYLKTAYKPLAAMGKKDLIHKGVSIPLHAGAQKYFMEAGLTIPDAIKAK